MKRKYYERNRSGTDWILKVPPNYKHISVYDKNKTHQQILMTENIEPGKIRIVGCPDAKYCWVYY
jgi:hypothetical protein